MIANLSNAVEWICSLPAAWLAIWATLAVLTVVLSVLLRTKWRHAKAWKKCAVLSLWVHVLLACLATTVRIVSGSPGLGDQPPMRVRIVAELSDDGEHLEPAQSQLPDEASRSEPTTETPPINDQPSPELDDSAADDPGSGLPEPEDSTAILADSTQESPPVEAPRLLEPPPLEPQTDDVELPTEVQAIEHTPANTKQLPVEAPATDVEAPSAPVPDPQIASEPTEIPRPAATVQRTSITPTDQQRLTPARTPVPRIYADRFSENRATLAASRGGNARTERAVKSALAWLAAAQSTDGRWDAARHGAGRERVVLGHNRGGAGASADSGVTGLALLAFLGAGHTHRHGAYYDTVGDGLSYLRSTQRSNGGLYGDASSFARMYCHSMASFSASEAYAITRDRELEPMVRNAVAYSLAMQHPTDGGWRYAAGQTGDTSQLGWQLMALSSASLGGVDAPRAAWERIGHFLGRVRRGPHGGLAAYRPEQYQSTQTMTAEALLCRLIMADRTGVGVSPAAVREAVDSLLRQRPEQREINLYYWYYATLALHRLRSQSPQWEEAWNTWNLALMQTLLAAQQEDGSWPESSVWGGYGGRVYTTALAAMCLEAYYRYAPAPTNLEAAHVRGGPRSSRR